MPPSRPALVPLRETDLSYDPNQNSMATANPVASIAQPSNTAPGGPAGADLYGHAEDDPNALDPSRSNIPPTLREISSLASWTVSTYKPGCGVPALLSPSPLQFWQSDGPQPHLLTIHFFKRVAIVRLRVYLDFDLDESYTPTRMQFLAGTGMYDLTEFAEWTGEAPKGWVEIGLEGTGVFEEGVGSGGVLKCWVLQVRVCENHQNGKDTHVRGVQIFARDERVKGVQAGAAGAGAGGEGRVEREWIGEEMPDWMGEPEIR